MIAFFSAALALAGPTVLELPDPGSSYITLQAIVKVGPLSGKDQALAVVVNDILLDASESFNEDQLRDYSALAGESMRCTLSADHFRVQLEVPQGQMNLAGEIIADVLQHPRFDPEVLDKDVQEAPLRQLPMWSEIVNPYKPDFRKITRDRVMDFFAKTFVPSSTTIAIGGAFSPGDGNAAMAKYLADWKDPKPVPTYGRIALPDPPPALLAKHSLPISTIELYGPEYPATDSAFPAQLLVATALGAGKGSAMHQVLREKLGLSYEQVAFVQPTPSGFRTRLLMVRSPSDQDEALVSTMRDALLADVKTWTEATRLRAVGMARSYLENETVANPLFLDYDRVIGRSLEDQTFLQGYWLMKTGQPWNAEKLLSLMSEIPLGMLKDLATELVTNAQGAVVP